VLQALVPVQLAVLVNNSSAMELVKIVLPVPILWVVLTPPANLAHLHA